MNDDALFVIEVTAERYQDHWWLRAVLRQDDGSPEISELSKTTAYASGSMYAAMLNFVNQLVHEAYLLLPELPEPRLR